MVSGPGADAVELAAVCGLHLDDWQRFVIEVAMGERANGSWAATDVDIIASRQNGKNGAIEARELYGAVILGESIIHTAHLFPTARESYNRLLSLIEADADVRDRLVWQVASPASGYEMRFKGGGRVRFIARSRTSGRGLTGDLLVFDEAQDLDDDALGALLPTLSARPNPQAWYLGSAPGPQSHVWHRRRTKGRQGGNDRTAFFEFSADPDRDLDDPEAWAQGNPSLNRNPSWGVTEPAIEAERVAMSDEMFARERLSVSPELSAGSAVIDMDLWLACEDSMSAFTGPPVFAVDLTPDRSMDRRASIAVAGRRSDGLLHVEIPESRAGTAWVIDRMVELQHKWGGEFVADATGPAGSIVPDAAMRGVKIRSLSTRDHAHACGFFYDLVTERRLRHRPEPLLDRALDGAIRRAAGDGAWTWSRRSSAVDISPLVAATLALASVPDANTGGGWMVSLR